MKVFEVSNTMFLWSQNTIDIFPVYIYHHEYANYANLATTITGNSTSHRNFGYKYSITFFSA